MNRVMLEKVILEKLILEKKTASPHRPAAIPNLASRKM